MRYNARTRRSGTAPPIAGGSRPIWAVRHRCRRQPPLSKGPAPRPRWDHGAGSLQQMPYGGTSDRADVGGLRALLTLGHLELNPLVLVQAAVARHLDRGEVGEDVGTAVVGGDEPKTLVRVEPLHNAGNHARLLDGRSFPAIMDGNEVVRAAI